ncbi:GNAT family N-acetyltransferase [Breznakiella homolactica]|uniref:GNAT family N-acetyltransferase n=1 Tax=Breznakiella homolactica TaxID=2798577 RepID=A0A7T7XKB6_9SPIR|nr:GNAT family N-acetyltransferase [Breznakiella homolactica]QQO07936.1 GNAT family N-acetyltransferase [Breznakiella homolactica]
MMETVTFRAMVPGDAGAVYRLWGGLFPAHPLSFGEFNDLLFCAGPIDFSLYRVACTEQKIAGVACGAADRESETGFIQFIGVAEGCRRHGIGRNLMDYLAGEFRKQNIRKVVFSGYPRNYLVPGLDAQQYPIGLPFFESLGFTVQSRPVSMRIPLDRYSPPPNPMPGDFTLEPFADEHLAGVLWLCREYLHPEWVETVQKGYIKGAHSCTGVVCLGPGREVAGFAFYGMVGDDPNRFGPIGVDPRHRGKSIGAALLHGCLRSQKEAGCPESYFLWGDEGSVAVNMYTKNGFSVFSSMAILEKEL